MYKSIALIMHNKFGFNVLPVNAKVPVTKWERWQKEIQTIEDIENMNWNHLTDGFAGISGPNDLRFIDIDKIKNWDILDIMLSKLRLPKNYRWVVKSGSGSGAHIIFRARDAKKLFEVLGAKKGVYKLNLKINGYCDHIELRWSESLTLLPTSKHPSGGIYRFMLNEPDEMPDLIESNTLIEFIEEFMELKNRVSNIEFEKKSDFIKAEYNPAEINKAIDVLAKNLKENCYEEWMEIGFALASMGEAGREYFKKLSLANENYNDTPEAVDKKFDGFLKDYNGKTTIGTLFFFAKKYGFEFSDKEAEGEADPFKKVEHYFNTKYDFQYNTLKQKLFWKKIEEENYYEITDGDLATLFIELKSNENINISYENLKRLLISNFVPKFHPLKNYFDKLPEWDGIDYIDKLSDTIEVEEGSKPIWKICLLKWLIATVAGALSDTEVNHTAIILQGMQGLGKTRWNNSLIPNELKDYLYTGNIRPNDKDSKLSVVKNFIINLDELETLNRDEIGFLKTMMTQKDVELRRPYGYFEYRYKRRSSFIGSVNKLEFLNDPSGSRRFLCFAAKVIDYEHNIDMDKVYAQALHLYRKGERYWFNKAEADIITENNRKFTFQPFEEQLILEKYDACEKDDPEQILLTSTEIAKEIISDRPYNNTILRQIGMALTKNGFIKGSGYNGKHSVKKWIVKKLNQYSRDVF